MRLARLVVLTACAVIASAGPATTSAAAEGGTDVGLVLTSVSAVRGLHARRLPPLHVPAPATEEDMDQKKGQTSVATGAKPLTPTPLLPTQPRGLQAAADAPVVGGKLPG